MRNRLDALIPWIGLLLVVLLACWLATAEPGTQPFCAGVIAESACIGGG